MQHILGRRGVVVVIRCFHTVINHFVDDFLFRFIRVEQGHTQLFKFFFVNAGGCGTRGSQKPQRVISFRPAKFSRFFDHADERRLHLFLYFRQKIMGRVTTDDDHVCPHGGEALCGFEHFRNRARPFAENAFGTVRDVGVVVDDRVDVLLIFDGLRCHNDLLHQVYSGHGAHAPHNANGFHAYLHSAAELAARHTDK